MITETDAIRTVGQLLLHHSTSHAQARTRSGMPVAVVDSRAESFCLIGAVYAVQSKLCAYFGLEKCKNILGLGLGAAYQWDNADDATRLQWAQTLADYQG